VCRSCVSVRHNLEGPHELKLAVVRCGAGLQQVPSWAPRHVCDGRAVLAPDQVRMSLCQVKLPCVARY